MQDRLQSAPGTVEQGLGFWDLCVVTTLLFASVGTSWAVLGTPQGQIEFKKFVVVVVTKVESVLRARARLSRSGG